MFHHVAAHLLTPGTSTHGGPAGWKAVLQRRDHGGQQAEHEPAMHLVAKVANGFPAWIKKSTASK